MKFTRKIITPEEAQEILSRNSNNRKIDMRDVKKYARDLSEGRWEEDNPQGSLIVIGEDGKLKDGQHRLAAICESGVSAVWTLAICDDEVGYFDMPRKRTIGNYIQMNRGLDSKLSRTYITGAIKLHLSVKNNYPLNRYNTNTEVADYIESHQEILMIASSIVTNGSKNALCRKVSIFHAIYAALMSGIDAVKLHNFCNIVNSGFSSSETDFPAISCRNLLLKASTRNPSTTWETGGICEEYIKRYLNNSSTKTTVKNPSFCYTNILFEMESLAKENKL